MPAPEIYLCYAVVYKVRALRARLRQSYHMAVLTFLAIGTSSRLTHTTVAFDDV